MREHWRWIKEYGHRYKISDRGRVKSFQGKSPRILSQHLNGIGKERVTLYCYGYRYIHTVDTIVKKTFGKL